ncbi:MAG: bifunctional 4-hydroxy-2-oxoglutarate aldolase/2-dehydro-3-deoxy-phosphogluconate aldolase [Actinomycetota bacterium]|nr:bifunctional 4-hydroxy-2-oxoglutarate aldolase/2-dehydro-3-deoxy-phosphogluconate aldolase [Actinomycetota bacterium]
MSRAQLPTAVTATRVIAVLRGLDPDRVEAVAGVLRSFGITAVEITMDSPDATSSIEGSIRGNAVVGAGTVMSIADADEAVAAGAEFLVSPYTDLEVVRWAVERGIPMIPGTFTPTEVAVAWNAGAAAVKVFPASVGGPGLLKAIRGPFGDLPLVPTGGITASNAGAFLAAGAVAVGVGGWLTDHDDLAVVGERAGEIVAATRR